MFNLIDQLTEDDKNRLNKYIELYGTATEFIGLDAWLQYWAKNKIKLYKLLGNSFIKKIPYEYEKPEAELKREFGLLLRKSSFIGEFDEWLWHKRDEIPSHWELRTLSDADVYAKDKFGYSIKIKRAGATRELQIQEGMKPIRVINKLLMYYKDEEGVSELLTKFEEFRIQHSIIFNDRKVKGNVVISIHPLDFMTMSDNSLNWQSCMNWTDGEEGGCYHVGTVEMMNSNNVVCCYLESKEPFLFDKKDNDADKDPYYNWSNKRWRQLVYVTKDIIVSGKPYPFVNIEMTKFIISSIREMAKENLHWFYSFGPERYLDMKHIQSLGSVEKIRRIIRNKETKKHNIIFDTKGMYNDMLNDQETEYWCVRNKVDHNKIISYSGKAPCLCCGKSVVELTNEDEDYNDRYNYVGQVVCQDCMDTKFNCGYCGEVAPTRKLYVYKDSSGDEHKLCERCWEEKVRICPHCGKPMIVPTESDYVQLFYPLSADAEFKDKDFLRTYFDWSRDKNGNRNVCDSHFDYSVYPVFMHKECAEALGVEKRTIKESLYYGKRDRYVGILPYGKDYSAFEYKNLERYIPKEGEIPEMDIVTQPEDFKPTAVDALKKNEDKPRKEAEIVFEEAYSPLLTWMYKPIILED